MSQWRRRHEDGWAHDLDALARLIRPETRMLYLNQPHNPTGTLMARPVFEQVIGLARDHGLILFSDEVYRELEHDPAQRLPPACDVYERAVSLGSISKSYGLPGLRIGWVATRDSALRDAVAVLKDYTTICTSAPSEFLTWVLDDAGEQDAAAVLTELPPPARLVYRWVLRPRYDAQHRWQIPSTAAAGRDT